MCRRWPGSLSNRHDLEGTLMVTRQCIHCEAEIEVAVMDRATCPVCGLDPDLPPLAYQFDDAPAFFLGGDPRRPAATALGRIS
jgi:hypothetical protein